MKYTQQEKVQTLMLCEIFKALKIKESPKPYSPISIGFWTGNTRT